MKSLRTAALLVAAASVVACGDPLEPVAQGANVTFGGTIFALSGSPSSFPSAFNTTFQTIQRADGGFAWDVAFDIDPQGRVLAYPVHVIGGAYAAQRSVGIQPTARTFDSTTVAPADGYQRDSALVVAPGSGILIQVASALCQFDFSPVIHAKLFVESVNLQTRSIIVRGLVNPNCGFRSLEPGVPQR